MSWKSLCSSREAPSGRLLLDRLEEHGLRLHRKLADLVEEDDAAVGLLEIAVVVGHGAGEGALLVAEERRLGRLAGKGRAVDVDEGALDLARLALEQVDLLCKLALSGACRAGEEYRVGGADGDPLDGFDEAVEGLVLRVDALLEEGEVVLPFDLEALGELVVAREVEVDDAADAAGVARMADMPLLGRGLHKLRLKVVRLGEQEEADLLHVRAGRDVDVVVRSLLVEAGLFGVVVELLVNLLEVPRVLKLHDVDDDLRLRGDRRDVRADLLRKVTVFLVEDQVKLVDAQRLLLDKANCRAPCVPARRACPAMRVLLRPENGYGCRFHAIYSSIVTRILDSII